jgi:hypothetical protein
VQVINDTGEGGESGDDTDRDVYSCTRWEECGSLDKGSDGLWVDRRMHLSNVA